MATPDKPPPAALWGAVVDHITADRDGNWHGNDLDREEVDSWLRSEATAPDPP